MTLSALYIIQRRKTLLPHNAPIQSQSARIFLFSLHTTPRHGPKPNSLRPSSTELKSILKLKPAARFIGRDMQFQQQQSKSASKRTSPKPVKQYFYACRQIILSAIFLTNSASCSTNRSVGLNERISSSIASLDITSI